MAWPNFSVTDGYAALVAGINTAFQSVGKLFKDQTTGDFTDQVRYNSSLGKLEYWTGSAWAALPMTGTAAGTAATLATARTIGGVSFNGSASINLPGVNTAGNQNTSGNAATATAAYGSSFRTAQTDVEGNIGVSLTDYADAYLFNNTTAWGLYSPTGSIMCQYVRASGTHHFYGTADSAVYAASAGNAATATALSTASGSAPSYAARATGYAGFTSDVPQLMFGQNISSVTDIAVGRVKFNFSSGPGTTNYTAIASIYTNVIGDRQGGVFNVESSGVTTYGAGGNDAADYPVMLACFW